jgi:2-keto-myo-inositol isomerase
MSRTIKFALNHMTAPGFSVPDFLKLAQKTGCYGVELRNDLQDKQLSQKPFFDGMKPRQVGDMARDMGLRLLGLSEAYGFNDWSETMADRVKLLIEQAAEAGAETISLIPLNQGSEETLEVRQAKLVRALEPILQMLEGTALVALIEPLGFPSCSLRVKQEAITAIAAIQGEARFKLVHDSFHHYLAQEVNYFPQQTGIVHISGVVDEMVQREDMQDAHRILVDAEDRLENILQIRALLDLGYDGAFSFEPFSAKVHALNNVSEAITTSMRFIRDRLY